VAEEKPVITTSNRAVNRRTPDPDIVVFDQVNQNTLRGNSSLLHFSVPETAESQHILH
jgi:hypothetical protein